MLQRLKGFNLDSFLDTKIAEEQAKQAGRPSSSTGGSAAGPAGARRSGSTAASRRSAARADSSGTRTGSRLRNQDAGSATPTKAPDPEEFVIGDDVSDISRAGTPLPGTPVPVKEDADEPISDSKDGEAEAAANATAKDDASATPVTSEKPKERTAEDDGLPMDVRKKLARLDTLTTKYQDLLRNYRTAHARVSAIEPFEATLREHTSLTSIADPTALVEFLNQRSLQSEMVMEELKRVTTENRELTKDRDELKVKLEEAEKKVKQAFDEAAGLKEGRKDMTSAQDDNSDPLSVHSIQQAETAPAATGPTNDEDETFFSYETELPRLEAEIQRNQNELEEQKEQITKLSTENAALREGLESAQRDLGAANDTVSLKERETATLQTQLEESQKAPPKESPLDRSTKDIEREKKMKEIHAKVINQLKEEVEDAKGAKRTAEGRANELQFEIKKLESEANASGEIITRLRENETLSVETRRQLATAERERDEARRLVQTKKGHEAAAASLRSQLKQTERDRDAAYQMIIDCGKCTVPESEAGKSTDEQVNNNITGESASQTDATAATSATEPSTQPADADTATTETATPATGEGKSKKKKKKSKAKKTDSQPEAAQEQTTTAATTSSEAKATTKSELTIQELMEDPKTREELLRNADHAGREKLVAQFLEHAFSRVHDHNSEEHEKLLAHHERIIEEREKTIRDKDQRIETLEEVLHTKNIVVEESMRRVREAEDRRDALSEEQNDLHDMLADLGTQATNARHELTELREEKRTWQEELDELQAEHDAQRKTLKEAESQRDELQSLTTSLKTQIETLQQAGSVANAEQLRAMEKKLQASELAATTLQIAKDACDKQIEELKALQAANSKDTDEKYKMLSDALDESRDRQTELEKDLAAANQLAQSRFRDLSDLREHVNSTQPEIKRLRDELAAAIEAKAGMEKSASSLAKLETKEKELRAEITEYKSQMVDKNREISSLKEKVKKGDERSAALEDTYEKARRDLEQNEKTRDDAVERRERAQTELKKAQDEVRGSRTRLEELERKVQQFRDETGTLRDELQLKSAQQASAQSLLDSMQDQTRELATQMKEVRERNDSLEEELADAHRLLSERGREGETMRRLLADVEGRADGRVKEMRERMDLAIEERDRAEDEASSVGRRKAREVEELKTKLREAERGLSRATEAREEAERRERDLRTGEDELRRSATRAQDEATAVRTAMAQLRDSLDEGERQAREGEKDRAALKRTLEEREARLEKLQKSSRSMAEELRTLQAAAATAAKSRGGSVPGASPSSRSSVDSSRVMSPVPRGLGSSNGTTVGAGSGSKDGPDYVYLKNVLLQFVEQKEKKHQMQLVPVLAMLLHFDKQDEQKWMTAISAK